MSQYAKPAGHVPVPLIIFGFVSLLLGAATELLGTFRGLTKSLMEACMGSGMEFRTEMGLPDPVGVLVTAAMVFGLIAALLGTPGNVRRVIIGISALLLTLTLIPSFAVWGIFWKPFGMTLAVIWGWMSATIYAHSHRMPCEAVVAAEAENVIDLVGERAAETYQRQSDGKS